MISKESHPISHAGLLFHTTISEGISTNFFVKVFHCISFAKSTSDLIAFQCKNSSLIFLNLFKISLILLLIKFRSGLIDFDIFISSHFS
jgi:hypothetical protein